MWNFREVETKIYETFKVGDEYNYYNQEDINKTQIEIYYKDKIIDKLECPYCKNKVDTKHDLCQSCNRIVLPKIQYFTKLIMPLNNVIINTNIDKEYEIVEDNSINLKNYAPNISNKHKQLSKLVNEFAYYLENELQSYLINDRARA